MGHPPITSPALIPANSYVYAFTAHFRSSSIGASDKVKIGLNYSQGYTQINGNLPAHTNTAGQTFFVCKRPSANTGGTIKYIGMYTTSSYRLAGSSFSSLYQRYGNGDVTNLPSAFGQGSAALIQGLSTVTKNW